MKTFNDACREAHTIAGELGLPRENLAVIGSCLIMGKGNDIDLLMLNPGALICLKDFGFEVDLEELLYDDTYFHSWRRESVNIIETTSTAYFAAEVAIANAVAKIEYLKPGLMSDRESRVTHHASLRDIVTFHLQGAKVS